jgi:hypothetical protein
MSGWHAIRLMKCRCCSTVLQDSLTNYIIRLHHRKDYDYKDDKDYNKCQHYKNEGHDDKYYKHNCDRYENRANEDNKDNKDYGTAPATRGQCMSKCDGKYGKGSEDCKKVCGTEGTQEPLDCILFMPKTLAQHLTREQMLKIMPAIVTCLVHQHPRPVVVSQHVRQQARLSSGHDAVRRAL